jgi:hypothetical protein
MKILIGLLIGSLGWGPLTLANRARRAALNLFRASNRRKRGSRKPLEGFLQKIQIPNKIIDFF